MKKILKKISEFHSDEHPNSRIKPYETPKRIWQLVDKEDSRQIYFEGSLLGCLEEKFIRRNCGENSRNGKIRRK